jgi:hypothetical protein
VRVSFLYYEDSAAPEGQGCGEKIANTRLIGAEADGFQAPQR